MYQYVRVKIRGQRAMWAEKRDTSNANILMYHKCTKSGETIPHSTLRVFLAALDDIIYERPAEMNLKYAELEIS